MLKQRHRKQRNKNQCFQLPEVIYRKKYRDSIHSIRPSASKYIKSNSI